MNDFFKDQESLNQDPVSPETELHNQPNLVVAPDLTKQKKKNRFFVPLVVCSGIIIGFILPAALIYVAFVLPNNFNIPGGIARENEEAARDAMRIATDIVSVAGVEKVDHFGAGARFGNGASISIDAHIKNDVDVYETILAISRHPVFNTPSPQTPVDISFFINGTLVLELTKRFSGPDIRKDDVRKIAELYKRTQSLDYSNMNIQIQTGADDKNTYRLIDRTTSGADQLTKVWNRNHSFLYSADCSTNGICPSRLQMYFPLLNIYLESTSASDVLINNSVYGYAIALAKKYTGDYMKLSWDKNNVVYIDFAGLANESEELGSELYGRYVEEALLLAKNFGVSAFESGKGLRQGAEVYLNASGVKEPRQKIRDESSFSSASGLNTIKAD